MSRSSVDAQQKQDLQAQKSAAQSVPGAPGSGATQPNNGPPQVMRDGQVPKPTEKAAAQPLGKTVRYPDGVQVDVVKISHETSTEQGRGAAPGANATIFAIRIANDSKRTLNLNQVVITVTIDNGKTRAQPIYLDNTNDFSGTTGPRASATTNYGFTIPTANLADITLIVDFDGQHTPAVFHGSAR